MPVAPQITSYGDAIRDARSVRGMSQADLARLLGTTQQTIGRWEQGQRPQPRWRKKLDVFLVEARAAATASRDPGRPPLRLAPEPSDVARPELDGRQARALDAFFARAEAGAPLSSAEAEIFQTAFSALGLDGSI